MSRAHVKNPTSLLICFSHLRWDFVFQRPQHLMQRFARNAGVIYWEEPVHDADGGSPRLDVWECAKTRVTVVTPHIPSGLAPDAERDMLRATLDTYLRIAHRRQVARKLSSHASLLLTAH